jgi:hypothetical protein
VSSLNRWMSLFSADEETKREEIEMKNLFLWRELRRLTELSLHQMIGVLGIVMLTILLNSCASPPFVYNIESKSELKGNKKILAGRFVCFDNDAPVHCTRSGFLIYFNKEGDLQAKLFSPDDAGYVYIPVTAGYYYFGTFVKGGKDESFIFNPVPVPVVLVPAEDSVVNFGTLEARFYQSPESKGSTAQSGRKHAQWRINHIDNYDVTRSEIASRVGKIASSISNGTVQFLPRARK